MARPRLDSADELTVRVAELYYREGKTQDEVGDILQITRWKVGRLLQRARDEGVIRIEIVHSRARRDDLEKALLARSGLSEAVVIPAKSTREETLRAVAQITADYLSARAGSLSRVGMSWGHTLHQVAQAMPEGWNPGVQVVQVNGAMIRPGLFGLAESSIAEMARKGPGQAIAFPTPAIVEREETAQALASDRSIREVLALAADVDMVVLSAGPATVDSAHVASGFITAEDVRRLADVHAVGDVLGRFITETGEIADPELDRRTLGIDIETLRSLPRRVLVAVGEAKVPVIRGCLAGGLVTALVTDDNTAEALLSAPLMKEDL